MFGFGSLQLSRDKNEKECSDSTRLCEKLEPKSAHRARARQIASLKSKVPNECSTCKEWTRSNKEWTRSNVETVCLGLEKPHPSTHLKAGSFKGVQM